MVQTTNSNGKGFQPKTSQASPQQPASNGDKPEYLVQLHNDAQSVIASLKQAELHGAAAAIARQSEQFEVDSEQISQVLEVLMDPQAKVHAAYVKAAARIGNRRPEALKLPFGGYGAVLPQLPALPSFSAYYSESGRSQHQLSATSNGSKSNGNQTGN
jgi:hypothetical protein